MKVVVLVRQVRQVGIEAEHDGMDWHCCDVVFRVYPV